MNESDIGELERLSSFLQERLVVVPSGGKDLVEYLRTFKAELEALEVVSASARVLVDGYIALTTAELRAIAIRERLKMACIVLTVGSLLVLALVLPHAHRCLSEALGRDVWDGDAEVMR